MFLTFSATSGGSRSIHGGRPPGALGAPEGVDDDSGAPDFAADGRLLSAGALSAALLSAAPLSAAPLTVVDLLDGVPPSIGLCAGSGGVGKTMTVRKVSYGVGVENVLNRMRDDQISDLLQMLAELLQGAGYRDAWLAVLSAKTAMPERYEPPPENNRLRRPRLAKRGARKRLTRAHIAAGTRPW